MAGQPLEVTLFPSSRSEADLYEDDGETLDYQQGVFSHRRFSAEVVARSASSKRTLLLDVRSPEGRYRPATRDLILSVWFENPPERTLLDGVPLPRVADLRRAEKAWTFDRNGFAVVKVPDKFETMRLIMEGG
jgi:Domain of unknown function (DUF5110)